MENRPRPTFANGKICYIEIPATDIHVSMTFYKNVFKWTIREHGEGRYSFDDAVGEVSGMWVTDRPAMTQPGLVISIWVTDIHATVADVIAAGGTIVRPVGKDSPELIAWFSDPTGNVLGLYQEPG